MRGHAHVPREARRIQRLAELLEHGPPLALLGGDGLLAHRCGACGDMGACADEEEVFWRALANPWRRWVLDLLRGGPRTTGDLAARPPRVSRFAAMQHLAVLTDAGLVVVEGRGRQRFDHVNAAARRQACDRWVNRIADGREGRRRPLRTCDAGRGPPRAGRPSRRARTTEEARAASDPRLLRRVGLAGPFAAVVTSVEHGRRKPCRTIYAHALALTGGAPGETPFVGVRLRACTFRGRTRRPAPR